MAPSPAAGELPDLPVWLQEVCRDHDLLFLGGLAICRRCGGMRSGAAYRGAALLSTPCTAQLPPHCRQRLRRALQGTPPEGHGNWPDGSPAGPLKAWRLKPLTSGWTHCWQDAEPEDE